MVKSVGWQNFNKNFEMFNSAAIIVNSSKDGALEFAREFSEKIEKYFQKVDIFSSYPVQTENLDGHDLCFTIGGDGTLLGIASILAKKNIPVVSINHGSLGFLSTTNVKNALGCVQVLKNGQFYISERHLIQANIGENAITALNEIVLRSVDCAHATRLELRYNNKIVARYVADGLIISSSTGSTAYNLSAGGPVAHPDIQAILATSICPHSGPKNTIMFPAKSVLTVNEIAGKFAIYADGNYIDRASNVEISTAEPKLKIIQLSKDPFFATLGEKLDFD